MLVLLGENDSYTLGSRTKYIIYILLWQTTTCITVKTALPSAYAPKIKNKKHYEGLSIYIKKNYEGLSISL